ncbi:MAG: hypothetical protein EOP88_20480 [Verrucomicrobiaceae bacterium]|nr:MAG: hypothetical protein EOP88_20480 [Verrucomicrobiaceae bacterium]
MARAKSNNLRENGGLCGLTSANSELSFLPAWLNLICLMTKSRGLPKPAKWLILVILLPLFALGLAYYAYPRLRIDPAPKGEGSFKEADAISKKFRDYYQTRDAKVLPQGYERLEGINKDEPDGTWIIYYATGSHSMVRGGTIVLLDSDGTISTYFGHHCSGGDGGKLIVSGSGADFYSGYYEGGARTVRAAFEKAFKHQKTEQAGKPDGGNPSK